MRSQPRLSIVIPAYNEEHRLAKTLQTIQCFLFLQQRKAELIVVDDGSCDRTCEVAQQMVFTAGALRILRNKKNRGKGAALRRGIAAAQGSLILFTDADLSTPIQELLALEAGLTDGVGAAIASRGISGARVTRRQPFYRELMGKIFNRLVQLFVLPGIHDTQCGFKLFRRDVARQVFKQVTISRFGFDVEVLYLVKRLGLRIAEVPVEWRNVLESKVSPLKDALQMFFDLFRILLRHRRRS